MTCFVCGDEDCGFCHEHELESCEHGSCESCEPGCDVCFLPPDDDEPEGVPFELVLAVLLATAMNRRRSKW